MTLDLPIRCCQFSPDRGDRDADWGILDRDPDGYSTRAGNILRQCHIALVSLTPHQLQDLSHRHVL
jgi:hypothetical protein